MNLTGKELVELGIVTGVDNPECIQQHSVDLELIKVDKLVGDKILHGVLGLIPKEGKTQLSSRLSISPQTIPVAVVSENQTFRSRHIWYLTEGVYEVTFYQGCIVPPNQRLEIVHRSSLYRNGSFIKSSFFDAGFKTDKVGSILIVNFPIRIEVGARIATMYATASNQVQNLYNGQWQGDQQRQQD